MKKAITLNTKQGTTLVEIAITVLIITIIAIVMFSSISYSEVLMIKSGQEAMAVKVAQSRMEKILRNQYSSISVSSNWTVNSETVGGVQFTTRYKAEYVGSGNSRYKRITVEAWAGSATPVPNDRVIFVSAKAP